MDADCKKLLRKIVKRVHPDLFNDQPEHKEANTKSLAVLNSYLEDISKGRPCQESHVEFWLSDNSQRSAKVKAVLPAAGSLGPLLYSFGFINEDQLLAGFGTQSQGDKHTSLLSWLDSTIKRAGKAAALHAKLRDELRMLMQQIEDTFLLKAIQLEGEYSMRTSEQIRHREALLLLQETLSRTCCPEKGMFKDLTLRVYHPKSDGLRALKALNRDLYQNLLSPPKVFVGNNGITHIIADPATIENAFMSLDLTKASLLADVASFWSARTRDLSVALKQLLGVQRVICDTRGDLTPQAFVAWAGKILQRRKEFAPMLRDKTFAFSLLAHCDESAPHIEFTSASSVLQVCMSTEPEQIIQYLLGSFANEASESVRGASTARLEEDRLLEEVRKALGVRQVIRVCPSSEHLKVVAAAKRLLANAEQIRCSSINLEGACLAIDDRYELWESGFISIPCDFQLSDLQSRLLRILPPSKEPQEAVPGCEESLAAEGNGDANLVPNSASDNLDSEKNKSQLLHSHLLSSHHQDLGRLSIVQSAFHRRICSQQSLAVKRGNLVSHRFWVSRAYTRPESLPRCKPFWLTHPSLL